MDGKDAANRAHSLIKNNVLVDVVSGHDFHQYQDFYYVCLCNIKMHEGKLNYKFLIVNFIKIKTYIVSFFNVFFINILSIYHVLVHNYIISV